MIVADLMTRDPASVRTHETLAAAAKIMWDSDCGAVPVVGSDEKRLVGIITDRDICMAAWSRSLAPNAIFVGEAMSRDPVRCGPNDTVARATEQMRSKQIRRIPVVDSEERLVGIISLSDIARATCGTSAPSSDRDLSSDGLASTLAGICRAPGAASGGEAAAARQSGA
jgi:CBS domain-containing protein